MISAGSADLIHPRELSDLIGRIYDCVLAPEGWNGVLVELADRLNSVGALLAVHDTATRQTLLARSVGYEGIDLAAGAQYGSDVQQMWQYESSIDPLSWPLGEPLSTRRCIPTAVIENNRYYMEWAKPNGLCDSLSFIPMRQPDRVAEFAFGRHESVGFYEQRDFDLLRLFTPHLRRAVVIGDVLNMQSLVRSNFEATLDRLSAGVFLVDGDARILHANAAGAAMLSSGGTVTGENGVLGARHPAVTNSLRKAIERADEDEATLGASGIGIPVHPANPSFSVLHVLPLRRGDRGAIAVAAAAAVFVSTSSVSPLLPLDALTGLFSLTGAETRVLAALVSGKTKSETAELLGVLPSTVHTHVMRLFSKVGVSRQSDLIQLVQSLGAPVVA